MHYCLTGVQGIRDKCSPSIPAAPIFRQPSLLQCRLKVMCVHAVSSQRSAVSIQKDVLTFALCFLCLPHKYFFGDPIQLNLPF